MKRIKRKIRIKWENIIVLFFVVIFFVLLIISLINIFGWKDDAENIKKQINDINDIVDIQETTDNNNTEIIEQEKVSDESDPYWDYVNMSLINVDFDELRNINSQTKGWIQINGTNVNYPFVQAKDNSYYLTHSFDKSYNGGGWVFLDYRNNIDNMDRNTIIYAHGRQDNTMFGSLRKILTNGWLKDKNNFVIRLSMDTENTLWQVFSVYKIPTTSDYLQIEFYDDDEFLSFSDTLIDRSGYNFNTMVSANDKILTLSTCYDDYNKIVIHAKLIKKESR